MKRILFYIGLYTVILTGCGINHDKENIYFFEKVSEIKFPNDLEVLETVDNREFATVGVFSISLANLDYLKTKANFKPSLSNANTFPNSFLKDSANHFLPKSSIINWYRCNGCTDITIYIDTFNLKMWCCSLYPDPSGDFCCNDSIR